MDLGIRGRVALVTGASSGLGEAVALSLAAEGATLAVAARRTHLLAGVARRARAAGAQDAEGFFFDQTDGPSVTALVGGVCARFGPPEILVINGGGPKLGGYLEVGEADWDATYTLILKSALRLVDGVLAGMRERRWGRIVALLGMGVQQPIQKIALSNIFRTGIVAALKTLSNEVAVEGITINAIATGHIMTQRLTEIFGEGPDAMKRAAVGIPMGRAGTVAEFAPVVTFLCSERAGYITGQTVAVDGGWTAGLFG